MAHTVLVVEENADLRYVFCTALVFAGYQVIEAADAREALRVLESQTPGLIVLDLGLPFVAVQEIAAQTLTRGVALLAVTASRRPHDLQSLRAH